jgi:dATP pyrophosphohydrolase
MFVKSSLIEAHIFRISKNNIEFLLLKRSPGEIYPGLWQMVTVSIEKDESGYMAALREIKEETGLTPEKFWVVPNINSFYAHKNDEIFIIPVFAALVGGDSKVVLSGEHSDYQWVSKDTACKMLAWPGQRTSVEVIADYFINEKYYLNFVEISI